MNKKQKINISLKCWSSNNFESKIFLITGKITMKII